MNYFICRSEVIKNRKGYTLIELIIVVIILGILAAILVPKFNSLTPAARYKADIASAKTIAAAAVTYMTKNNVLTCTQSDIESYFATGSWPSPQRAAGGNFVITTDNGTVTSVTAGGVILWPTPASAVPANY